MSIDMLDRLVLDPGRRTPGELIQEREWAAGEIRRLRSEVGRLSRKRETSYIERKMGHAEGFDPALSAQRLLRLNEATTMLGIGRSTIYKYIGEGSFSTPIRIGIKSVTWDCLTCSPGHVCQMGVIAAAKEGLRRRVRKAIKIHAPKSPMPCEGMVSRMQRALLQDVVAGPLAEQDKHSYAAERPGQTESFYFTSRSV